MNKKRILGLLLTAFAVAVLGVIFSDGLKNAVSASDTVWISIDENELETVTREMDGRLTKFDIDVSAIIGGIAIARINENGLAELSSGMHESFHKCSGFIVHESQTDAFSDVERALSTGTSENLVEYTIDNQANVSQMITSAEQLNLRQTILDMSTGYDTRRHDQPSGLLAANYVNFKWGQLAAGRPDISVAFFDNTNQGTRSTQQPSVILTIQGTTLPNEVVVLGAHLDSIRSGSATGLAPGADDDASGVASLTEAIRVIVDKNFRPNRTVKFMAYAAEEVGLWGSQNIAAKYLTDGVNVVGVLQLDMTNYKGNPAVDFAFATDFTNAAQNQFAKDLITEYLPTLTFVDTACGYGCSDHASWHNRGFVATFPFEAPFGQHNNALHTANDLISRSNDNANHAVKFSKLALAYVGELAKGSIPSVQPVRSRFDFDGDTKTDASIFRPAAGEWWYLRSSDLGNRAYSFGNADDTIAPADYTGDGKADVSFWRPSTGEWFVLRSEDDSFYSFPFGIAGDIPAPGDFNGDGKAQPAMFRPSNGTWYILNPDGSTTFQTFGTSGDKPIVGDYDGDGKEDVSIFRPSNSQWWIFRSELGIYAAQFGTDDDQAVPADYTGDGKADIAFWRPSTGEWFVLRSEDSSFYSVPFGIAADIPTPGDYDGDGKTDAAVFRTSNNTWYKQQTTNGFEQVTFGAAGDIPVPSAFVVP